MKLVIIDPFVSAKSPSMRSIVSSLDVILDIFSEVEVVASECDWDHPKVSFTRIPQRFKKWPLHSADFNRKVNRSGIAAKPESGSIVQVTGCITPRADIRYMHFWNNALLEEVAERPTFRLPPHKLLLSKLTSITERKTAANPDSTGHWWVVSRSISEKIREDANGKGEFRILPNEYNPTRFNSGVRTEWREQMRSHYQIHPEEKILVFSAFGHFERKGLLEAVQAIRILRDGGHQLRLLMLGGTPETLKAFKAKVRDFSEGIIFAGLVDHIERHLSAADGFFFPSHFEAFSLAEIEAAALGLRLYLTPHHGHGMILREPENGRLLPWDPHGMSAVIGEDLKNGRLGTFHSELGEAVDSTGYKTLLHRYYHESIAHRKRQYK